MPAKLTLDIVKVELEKEGYCVVSKKYINAHTDLDVVCSNSHPWKVSFSNWKKGRRCKQCYLEDIKSKPRKRIYINDENKNTTCKHTLESISEAVSEQGYSLISKKYDGAHSNIILKCPNKHTWTTTWTSFQSGQRCSYCSGKVKLSTKTAKLKLKEKGFYLLSLFNALKDPILVECGRGHQFETTFLNLRSSKFRCKECYKEDKVLTSEFVNAYLSTYSYQLVSDYICSDKKMLVKCPEGHEYNTTWDSFKYNERRCPICHHKSSHKERAIITYLENNNIEFNIHNREIIKPFELDIVIPSKKIAIEFCGLYYHSFNSGKRNYNYHLNKLKRCEVAGFRLITIFENEFDNKKDLMFSRLDSILNLGNKKIIYARKCNIKCIKSTDANNFLKNNHLQFAGRANIHLGAFYNDDLVAVMSFSKKNISKGFKGEDGIWELNRFATNKDCRVVGIASKLLVYFERNYDWKEIFSFADRRWSVGDVYIKLGFNLETVVKPNYWYFKPNTSKPELDYRYSHRKTKERDIMEWTEFKNRKIEGYDWIWDCGYLKFVKRRNNV